MSDRFDYNPNTVWIVDGKKYMNKVDAMLASIENNMSEISFYYYNKEFEAFDWTIEPKESWAELCRQRAQQLRDSNHYLRLWYSGGADSHTVLRAFLDNKIHLDEIVMVRASPIDDWEGAACRESNLRSIPYINSIRHQMPNTKVSLVNLSGKAYEEFYKTDDWFARTMGVYDFADDPSVLLDSRVNLERYGGLRVPSGCVEITGELKPKVIRHEGKYYFGIVDSSFYYMHWANGREFFTTPEFPILHSKQCHELKHIVERWYPDGNAHADIYHHLTMDPYFEMEWMHCCRDILNLEVDYGKSITLFSPKSLLRINDAKRHNPRLFQIYINPLRELQKEIQPYWKKFEVPMDNVISNWYCLGPYNKIK
jgi:hypothetical protein